MKVKIVYDNVAEPPYKKGWGFAALVELDREKILFDTGWDGLLLLSNLRKIGCNIKEIDKIFLSHSDWDHVGGISCIKNNNADLYVPKSLSKNMKGELSNRFKLHEVESSQKISNNAWSTGELGKKPKEQSLIVETREGLVVIVGCSHPGVRKILEKASELGELYGLVGGFHDFKDYEVLESLSIIVPTHCTSHKKEIFAKYPERSMEGRVGLEIEVK